CAAPAASGETVQIGNAAVAFASPQGFSRADALFPIDLTRMDGEFGTNTVVFAQFVPTEEIAIREADVLAIPSWYAHLSYDDIFSRVSIGKTGFIVTTYLVEKTVARQYGKADFLRELETIISGALSRRKIIITFMTHKGFVEKKPGFRSMLAYGRGQVATKEGMEDFQLATLTSFYLSEGKLLTLIQATRIQDEKDLPLFTAKALRIAAEMTGYKTPPPAP
ncbi:MAG: hypothetical protein LBS89_01140, partial [Zoogloeaceae bacterium]|nr:hypothetical protein [Zoogloeaceae bacterium]